MRIRVRWFAVLRERRGAATEELEVADGLTAAEVYATLCPPADLPVAYVVNGATAAGATRVAEGDELAFLPPVGGG